MDVVAGPELRTDPSGPAADRAGGVVESLGGVVALRWPDLGRLGVEAIVTTRFGGVSAGPYDSLNLGLHVGDDPSAVVENRRLAAAAVGARLQDLVVANQVHGTRVEVVGRADHGAGATGPGDAVEATDALVTTEPGVVLVTLVADCTPILLVDPVARVLCTVHAGWRGTVAGIVAAALARATSLGATVARVQAVIGPCADATTYEVGEEVAEAVRDRLGAAADGVLSPTRARHWLLDLPGANRRQLLAAGVRADAVRTSALTTSDRRFFSDRHRRPCGRFGLFAWLAG